MDNDVVVAGIWKDTLFPAIKDLVRYGADKLDADDNRRSIVNAAVDTAAATLATLVPDLLPFISSLTGVIKPRADARTKQMIDAVKSWTIRGPQYPLSLQYNNSSDRSL